MESQVGFNIRSDVAGLDELLVPYGPGDAIRRQLVLGDSWTRRWSTAWKISGGEVVWPVRDMASVQVASSEPVRRFTWQARQRHRPGLQFMVSTGRHHGFDSLEEQRLLLALDFLTVVEVLPQPFRLDFEHERGRVQHVPDFLAVRPDGAVVVLDVRPADRIGALDALKFAATGEAALACGWQYVVVAGWRPHVHSVLDHLSSQRRPLEDHLGLQPELLEAAASGHVTFGEMAARTRLPVVARAHAVHLLWHRRLAVDLGRPLGDSSVIGQGLGARGQW
ncbi:TnsA-like heteromeric transposase endonuclease subunit [Streptomyces sp. NPDC059957]|uniref:TnsA-like heteromeric transposase endonuclease subunit n=1 Tax=Streptomyces sp. NPDC059957 TaxID=3347016 RepID=UPI0036475869